MHFMSVGHGLCLMCLRVDSAAAAMNGGHAQAHYSSAPGGAVGPAQQGGARQPTGADAIFAGLNVELKEASLLAQLPSHPWCCPDDSHLAGQSVPFRSLQGCLAVADCSRTCPDVEAHREGRCPAGLGSNASLN